MTLRSGHLGSGRDSWGASDGSVLGRLAGLLSDGLGLGLGLGLLSRLGLFVNLGLLILRGLLGNSVSCLVLGLLGRLLARLALALSFRSVYGFKSLTLRSSTYLDGSTELGEGVCLGLLAVGGGLSLLAGASGDRLALLAEGEGEGGLPLVGLQVLLLAVDSGGGLRGIGGHVGGAGHLGGQRRGSLDSGDDRSFLNYQDCD